MRNIGPSTRSGHETMQGVLSSWFLLVLVYSYNFPTELWQPAACGTKNADSKKAGFRSAGQVNTQQYSKMQECGKFCLCMHCS